MSYRKEPKDIHEVAQVIKELRADWAPTFWHPLDKNPLGTPRKERDPNRPTKLKRVGPGQWEPR